MNKTNQKSSNNLTNNEKKLFKSIYNVSNTKYNNALSAKDKSATRSGVIHTLGRLKRSVFGQNRKFSGVEDKKSKNILLKREIFKNIIKDIEDKEKLLEKFNIYKLNHNTNGLLLIKHYIKLIKFFVIISKREDETDTKSNPPKVIFSSIEIGKKDFRIHSENLTEIYFAILYEIDRVKGIIFDIKSDEYTDTIRTDKTKDLFEKINNNRNGFQSKYSAFIHSRYNDFNVKVKKKLCIAIYDYKSNLFFTEEYLNENSDINL